MREANKHIFFKHFLDLMRLIYAALGLLLVLIASAQCQQTATDAANTQLQSNQTHEEPLAGDLLYSDDFSSSKSGWYTSGSGDFMAVYKNGKYHLTEVSPNVWGRSFSPDRLNFSDFVLEIEATKEAGPDDNAFGVIVREIDSSNYYAFLLSSDGYYQVAKLQNNSWTYVSDWAKSSAVKTGNATNLIKVVCNRDKQSFYANGVKLTDYSDSSFAYGHIGLYAGTQSEGNVTIGFDNLTVLELK
jgi:hypothetical protein